MNKILTFLCVLTFFMGTGFTADSVEDYIKTSEINAEIVAPTVMYADYYEESGRICLLTPGETVTILRDRSTEWYYVHSENWDESGWVKAEGLNIPLDEAVLEHELTTEQLERYANECGYESDTDFLVVTDISRQKTYIFKGSKGNFKILKTLPCATGKNVSPTIKGTFKISERGKWFYSERLESGAKYWVRFSGPYLFHTVAMDKKGNIIDGVVSEKRSSGCVRFLVEDAEWFYKTIPEKTTVIIK